MSGRIAARRCWVSRLIGVWGVLVLFGMVVVTSDQSHATQLEQEKPALWSSVGEDTLAPPTRTWRIESRNYRILSLDRDALTQLLARAPRAETDEAKKTEVLVQLPWPDGSFRRFRIEEASVTWPGHPVQCPDVTTYRGRTDDRSVWVELQWSPSGLHAIMSSQRDQIHIRPYSPGDAQHHIVYYSNDWRPGPSPMERAQVPAKETAGLPQVVPASPDQSSPAAIQQITMEGMCRGCGISKLIFRRNGATTLMSTGILGMEHSCQGTVTPADFESVAALMVREKFFDLNDVYKAPVFDAPQVTISAVVGGRRHSVVNYGEAGPPNLKRLEDAISALSRATAWTATRP
jgi:hypothetical protein